MSRWADSTDDEDDYLHDGDHEDYVEHAIEADEVSDVPSRAEPIMLDISHNSKVLSIHTDWFIKNIEANKPLYFPFLALSMQCIYLS